MKPHIERWSRYCSEQHDKVGQTYGKELPYSFHLDAVYQQVNHFGHLLDNYGKVGKVSELTMAKAAAWGHDLLEDTNLTYNDVRQAISHMDGLTISRNEITEIIYCLTDYKGRNRAERKPQKYYDELCANEVALYVKLCDLIANKLYSRLTGSSMYQMYKREYPNFKEKTYNPRFREMYLYLESI
tara:strand:- start:4983 stop:5537 length:555 start_codon:yes stop_codon:yes gene_type:complete